MTLENDKASSRLIKLNLFLDKKGILRVGGRLSRNDFPFYTRHPIILAPEHHLTEILVSYWHLLYYHASTERLLSELRSSFWIIRSRQTIHRKVSKCIPCKRNSLQPDIPLMAALPPERLKPFSPPFTYTGIDYLGPLNTVMYLRVEKR